ncbi:MAG: hypothetical protein KKE17_11600 [Proteobacteria bacterium]|nr:hypothetical protein [Pseudomonadota bacterium]MBU1710639.1 hypothetical protein [Pseudomonadota bacterium]
MASLFTLLLFLLAFSFPESANSLADIRKDEKQQLEIELALAKKDRIYAVFDLRGKKIQLKAKSLQLQSFPINNIRFRGDALGVELINFERKESFQAPERREIRPGGKNAGDKVMALELAHMPTHFIMHFKEGIELTVVADSPDAGLARHMHRWAWELTARLPKIIRGGDKRRLVNVMLLMEPSAARALYWYVSENAEALIIPGG